jgi:hypothetical protein
MPWSIGAPTIGIILALMNAVGRSCEKAAEANIIIANK